MLEREAFFIAGESRRPSSRRRIDVVSPSTEEVIGHAPDADDTDVDAAVGAARAALDAGEWARRPIAERAAVIEAAFDALEPSLGGIASLITAEMGAPITMTSMYAPGALLVGRYYTGLARSLPVEELRGAMLPAIVRKEPVGVVAAIAPWNGPFNLGVNKVVPALLAGCSVVFKPAPETPFDMFGLVDALAGAGVPAGVLNVITGGRGAGAALVAHPGVDKVTFTGSTAAGRLIGEACGRTFKRVQLELGGKSAAIVLEDADLATTMAGLGVGCFTNSGQACVAYSRVLAPRSRYDEIVAALCDVAASFAVGDPFDPATTHGPLVTAQQRHRVESYIAEGVEAGAKVMTGGGRPAGLRKGWYVEPTVFAGADNSMRICREEIFGPVVAVIPYDTVDDAIAIANDSEYGLHGGVFTADDDMALRVAARIRTGTFSVNGFGYSIEAPFGGVKASGIGRDTGPEALASFFELKTVNVTPSIAQRYSSPAPTA